MTTNAPATSEPGPAARIATPALIIAMLDAGKGISDLIFSPGRPPQVEQHGQLVPVAVPEVPVLEPDDTARVARDLIGANEQALRTLKEEGACDLSYLLPGSRALPRQRVPPARHLRRSSCA